MVDCSVGALKSSPDHKLFDHFNSSLNPYTAQHLSMPKGHLADVCVFLKTHALLEQPTEAVS